VTSLTSRCLPPILAEILFPAAHHPDIGIWGGHDENERRLLHRQWRESRIAASAGPSQPLNPEAA
jgi:hypothetical protein